MHQSQQDSLVTEKAKDFYPFNRCVPCVVRNYPPNPKYMLLFAIAM